MDSTAIGDAVNVASRIESMTKLYDSMILISEESVTALGEYRQEFLMRFVDTVTAKGKSTVMNIWEIVAFVNVADNASQSLMIAIFEDAMAKYLSGDLLPAKKMFEQCLAIDPNDKVAEMWRGRCL